MTLRAPFPWFGGKSRAAGLIWSRLGDVPRYIEPFAGSLAVLLGRPTAPGVETVNDKDGFLANFWRAVQADPEAVAHHADWPVNEADLHARHAWLVAQRDTFLPRVEGDPEFYDMRIAGWWVWGICQWIGSGWCSGDGPWHSDRGVFRKIPELASDRGVRRNLPMLRPGGSGVTSAFSVTEWLRELAVRLRRTRVACGDWRRVLTPSVICHGKSTSTAGIVLDPPYAHHDRETRLYTGGDAPDVAADVAAWAREHGDDPRLRIALCGYEGEHDMPGWTVERWKAAGGYGKQRRDGSNANASRETIWFSPHCLAPEQSDLPLEITA